MEKSIFCRFIPFLSEATLPSGFFFDLGSGSGKAVLSTMLFLMLTNLVGIGVVATSV